MERRRAMSPAYNRQSSLSSNASGSSSSTPAAVSPGYRRSSSSSGNSGTRRNQNLTTKAANARLTRVMASQVSIDTEEDEYGGDYDGDIVPSSNATGGVGRFGLRRPAASSNVIGGLRRAGSPSPAFKRNTVETAPANRSASAGRPSLSIRSAALMPPIKTKIRSASPIPATGPSFDRNREKRFFSDVSYLSKQEPEPGKLQEMSALQDQVDMLEEENYNLLEQLQLAEERCKEAEDRSRELEKQVTDLGEGVSLEARLLSRKEAALRQREQAMKTVMRNNIDRNEEMAALQQQLQSAKSQVEDAMEHLREVESEAKTLKSMIQKVILTQEEMEEVVLKRCWLARYWSLAVQHGVYPEIAVAKHELWSSLAPLPFELVTSAGQRAKDESWSNGYEDSKKGNEFDNDVIDITGDGNIGSMLAVEKGLKELSSLKVEDAIMLALAQYRRSNLLRQSGSDIRLADDPKFIEELELSQEEAEDVHFKQAWLIYFWRRAKTHGIEEDIAEERLQFWIDRMNQTPTSHDAVDVERGLIELRKLGIEQQLWEASRREIDENHHKLSSDEENT